MKRVGIYLRVSTDSQTTENQRRELETVAARSGWHGRTVGVGTSVVQRVVAQMDAA